MQGELEIGQFDLMVPVVVPVGSASIGFTLNDFI
jgi:hypothetical protein